ncbi:MAG: sugar transporter [Alphaproteobacteria bacterium HGW-Alphaproteobacteria-15]|nr:MAG: sugar transporter [Alphaproteobacteria bacterium HGW-Alphaproteobacteria-15]
MGVKKAIAVYCLGVAAVVNAGTGVASAQTVDVPPAGTSQTYAAPEYRINPGDELQISVWREDQLQRAVMVLPDGMISFPLVGQIQGAGRTSREIEAAIMERLAPKYVDGNVPDVTVAVSKTSGLQFSVIGKVRSAGVFSPGRTITVLEALSFAGGVDEFASLDNIVIVRKVAEGLTVVPASLSSILRTKAVNPDAVRALPVIQSGDTIIVP